MELLVQREPSINGTTFGKLYVNGHYQCETLEDQIREVPYRPVSEWKVDGATAIPAGLYHVAITFSNRFQRDMPLVEGVEGFSGIRIHPGNTSADTAGCLLVGTARAGSTITNSRAAFTSLFIMIDAAIESGESVSIEYRNP